VRRFTFSAASTGETCNQINLLYLLHSGHVRERYSENAHSDFALHGTGSSRELQTSEHTVLTADFEGCSGAEGRKPSIRPMLTKLVQTHFYKTHLSNLVQKNLA